MISGNLKKQKENMRLEVFKKILKCCEIHEYTACVLNHIDIPNQQSCWWWFINFVLLLCCLLNYRDYNLGSRLSFENEDNIR